MTFIRSLSTISFFTITSRLLGFIRDILTAYLLGAGAAMDALAIAIKIPSLFRRLFAEGAFNAAFLPMFTEINTNQGIEEGKKFANEILSFLLMILFVLVITVEIFIPYIMPTLFPGLLSTPERLKLTIFYTHITFPFIFFISVTAFYGAILTSYEKFGMVSSSQAIGNLFIILVLSIGMVLHSGSTPILYSGALVASAITGCGLVQLLWVIVPAIRLGYGQLPGLPILTQRIRRFFKLMTPVLLGSGVYQVNVFIGTIIASFLPIGGISYLYYAERLNQLPLSVIGTALGTALLPIMARQFKKMSISDAQKSQNYGVEIALLLTLPATIALIILSHTFVVILFERHAFDSYASKMTAQALSILASGLPAYVLTKIFSTTFYAQSDTRTPFHAAILAISIDIFLSIILVFYIQHLGIAVAASVSAWIQCGYLFFKLKKIHLAPYSNKLKVFLPRVLAACLTTGLYLSGLDYFMETWIDGPIWVQISAVLFCIGSGVLVYTASAQVYGALNIAELIERADFGK